MTEGCRRQFTVPANSDWLTLPDGHLAISSRFPCGIEDELQDNYDILVRNILAVPLTIFYRTEK